MRTNYQTPCYSAEDCHYRVFPGYYKVQQLCPPSASSKIHASLPIALSSEQKSTSPISLSSYERFTGTQGHRLLTVIENSEFEILTLSSDSESMSEGGPDSESTLDREPVHVQIAAKCSKEDAPSAAGFQSGVRDIDCRDLSSEMRGPFAVRSKVSPVISVFAKSCGVRTPEFIQPQARVGDLDSGEHSDCLESPLRSRTVDIQVGDSPHIVLSGSSAPPPTSDESGRKSIMDLLCGMGGNKSGRSLLKSVDLSSFVHESVKHLPAEFNGD